MNIFTLSFPVSYMMLVFGLLIGGGVVIILFGSMSFFFIILLILFGIIRILPILEVINKIMLVLFPEAIEQMCKNIGESFPIEYPDGNPKVERGIYVFHPHGMFSLSHFFHVGTTLTKWDKRPIHGTAVYYLWSLPFGRELMDSFGKRFVPSSYESMKQVLKEGESLSVSLGGVREILYTKSGTMKLNIGKKRGIFRMALQTGTPLLPVLVYGENELFEITKNETLDWLQDFVLPYNFVFAIPTIKSCKNWFSLIANPLKRPVETVIGAAIEVGEAHEPTELEIKTLREKYILHLRDLYKRTKPDWYEKELIII